MSVFGDIHSLRSRGFSVELRGRGFAGLFANFIAPNIGEADGIEDVDLIDEPTNLGLPVNGFQDPARSGWSHDVIGDAFDLHFWPREEGVVAGDMECNAVVHEYLEDKVLGTCVVFIESEAEVF